MYIYIIYIERLRMFSLFINNFLSLICVTKCNYLKVNGKWGKVGKYWCGIDEDLITIFELKSVCGVLRDFICSLPCAYNITYLL